MNEPHGETPSEYRSYLLRLWRAGEHGPWRAMLAPVGRDERHSFSALDELFAYLETEACGEKS